MEMGDLRIVTPSMFEDSKYNNVVSLHSLPTKIGKFSHFSIFFPKNDTQRKGTETFSLCETLLYN